MISSVAAPQSAMRKLFDANVAIGPVHPARHHLSVGSLRELMYRFGIDQCLVYSGWAKWDEVLSGNRLLLREIEGDPLLVPCAVVIPAGAGEAPPEAEYVDQLLADGFRAARLCPNAHRLSLVETEIRALCSALAERRMPLLLDLDVGHWSDPRPWAFIEQVCSLYPELPLVLVRESQASLRTLLPMLVRFPNLMLETSYFQAHGGLELISERVGASRLCYGSGMPEWDAGPPISELTHANLAESDREAIASGSLQSLIEGCLL